MSLPSAVEIQADVVDYTRKVCETPIYEYVDILPQAGTQSFTVTSTQSVIFQIPANVAENLSRSTLDFTFTQTTAPSGTKYTYMNAVPWGMGLVRDVYLRDQAGHLIADLQRLNYSSCITRPFCTKFEDFELADTQNRVGRYSTSNVLATAIQALSPLNTNVVRNYTGPNYLINGAVDTALTFDVGLALGDLKGTVFCLDKDLMTPTTLFLEVVFQAGSSAGIWTGTSVTNPTSGAVAYTGTYGLTAVKMRLAMEKNQTIVNSLSATILGSGMSIVIPWTQVFSISLSGASQSQTVRLNGAYGRKLRRLFWAVNSSTQSVNTTYDHHATSIITSFDTYLNNKRINQVQLTPVIDYYESKLRGVLNSASIVGYDQYAVDYAHIDNFTTDSPADDDYSKDEGLDLSSEVEWTVQATVASATYVHYVVAHTVKTLVINAGGLNVM